MSATKLFTYKIRNPKATSSNSNEIQNWISLGDCYQDDDENNESSEPYYYFVFNDNKSTDNQDDISIQIDEQSTMPQITGDTVTHAYYNLCFQGGER